MTERYVRTFRVFSNPWDGNGYTLETNKKGGFRLIHEIVNGHLSELQAHELNSIVSIQAQDTLLDERTMMTAYTVVYEEQS
jgi:hypothetical protein